MMQFRLRTMFLYFVVLWSALAAFGLLGAAVATVVLLGGIYIHCEESLHRHAAKAVLFLTYALCMLTIVLGCYLVNYRDGLRREEATDGSCCDNLRTISLALQDYRQRYGCFPPACLADSRGRPMHSWRVLLLPYLKCFAVYDQYNFNEPWDGPNNRTLLSSRPREYGCPSHASAAIPGASQTNYVAVVGPGTAWSGSSPARPGGSPDEGGGAILLVETAGSDIPWTQPRDFTFEEACRGANRNPSGISSPHVRYGGYVQSDQRGAHVAFADGSVRFLPEDVLPETLKRLLLPDPAKTVDPDSALGPRLNWSNLVALVVFLVSGGMFLARPREKKPQEPAAAEAEDPEDVEHAADAGDAKEGQP